MGRYPANKLIGRDRIPERKVPKDPILYTPEHALQCDHPVLAAVSRGYPDLGGSLITCYSPVRHSTHSPKRAFAFDLHASSTPPTFVLSQDQTLHFMYVQSTLSCNNGPSQGSTWLFVAKPQSPTNSHQDKSFRLLTPTTAGYLSTVPTPNHRSEVERCCK